MTCEKHISAVPDDPTAEEVKAVLLDIAIEYQVHFPARRKYGYTKGAWHRAVDVVKTIDVIFRGRSVFVNGKRMLKCNVFSSFAGWVRMDYARLVDDVSGIIHEHGPDGCAEYDARPRDWRRYAKKVDVPNSRMGEST